MPVAQDTRFKAGAYGAVLFDLDGTLIDTAPDMVRALKTMQAERGIEPIDYAIGRSQVSNGAIGLLREGFADSDIRFGDPLHQEFLEIYARDVASDSRVFPELDRLLEALEAAAIPWGIVTNKPGFLTAMILDSLGLTERSAVTVCGDTLTTRKPDPAPLIHAAALAAIDPATTLYVGDARRDIDAGRGAGMGTIAVTYGYITADDDARRWQADAVAATPEQLAHILLTTLTDPKSLMDPVPRC